MEKLPCVIPGIPLLVAKVPRVTVLILAAVTVAVDSVAPEGFGLHSLYVGVPNGLMVVSDKFK